MLVFPFKNKKGGKIYKQTTSYHLITTRHSTELSNTEKYSSIRRNLQNIVNATCIPSRTNCYIIHLEIHPLTKSEVTPPSPQATRPKGEAQGGPRAAPLWAERVPAATLSDLFSVPLAWSRTRLLPARENQF